MAVAYAEALSSYLPSAHIYIALAIILVLVGRRLILFELWRQASSYVLARTNLANLDLPRSTHLPLPATISICILCRNIQVPPYG